MGFKVTRTFALDFSGTKYEGAEVTMKSAPRSIVRRIWADDATIEGQDEIFLSHVAGWNLEREDGQGLPIAAGAMDSIEAGLRTFMIRAWIEEMAQVPAPLSQRSGDGDSSPVESMTMETL